MQTENTYVETDLGNIAFNPRGEYSDETSYEYLDTVSYKGGSYVCLAELAKTTSGIAPEPGKNTEHWQMLTLPGGLTSDYIAMHDDVVNKAKQIETSRAAVELSQQEVEAAQADVRQMRQDTQEASQAAIVSRDSAAGYAQSAEASRTAAKESEDNINAQVVGFDTHVAEKESEAETAITEARRAAVSTVSTKQDDATQAVTDEGNKQIKNVEDAGTEQVGKVKSAGASAVSTAGAAGVSAVNAVKTQQTASIKVVADKGTQQVTAVNTAGSTQASIIETKGADQVKAIQEAGENALQNISDGVDKGLSEEGKAADAKATGEAISKLTEDLGNLDSDLYSISSNILDTNGLLENTAIKDWGNPTIDNYTYESAGKYSTRPIPVLADEIYKSIGYEFCYILFNSDGSFTTGNSLLNSTVGTIKIPNGIGYIVFMFSNYSNIPTGIMRVESEQETPVYKPYGEKEKKYATVGDIEEVKEQIDNVTTTEPSKNVLLDGVLLENTDLKTWRTVTINNYNYASTGKYSTSLIDCKSGDVFYPVFSNGKGSPSMGYTIFDANGNMIDHDWTVSKSNCVVPVGGTKAAFMFNNKKYDGLMLYTSVNNIPVFETTDPKEKYAKVETTDHYPMYDYGGMEIKMVGKILCIGDSYTEGGFDRKEGDTTYYFSDTELSYPSNLERITGCNVTNKGDGGKTCETWWNAHANDDLSGHKICIIQIGINDTNKQEDGWNSISDVNLTNIVNKVRSENNGIPIFIATLPNEWAYGTSAYTVTNERIRSIANTLGLFVIDFEKENGFVFARDILGGHPTSFGTWEIAREWANAISAYLSDNKALFTKLQYVGTDYSY